MKCAVSRLSWTSKCRCPKVPFEIVQIASHVSSSPRRQETPRQRSTTPHPDTTPSRERRRVLYIPHMEGGIMHPNQAIDIGARQRVRSPLVRCPRQPSARPAAAGVVVALHKISWICSCNVPRPLQIECKTTSTAAMEGNPINRAPGSRQKAPVRDRCDSPAPAPTGPTGRRGPPQLQHTLTRPPRANVATSCTFPTWKAASCTRTKPSTSARASVFAARTSGVPSDALLIRQDRGFRDSFNKSFFDL